VDAGDEAEQRARRILADSRAAYAACDTYEDDGTYDIVFRGDAGFHEETEFRTVVAGPNAMRFAYRDLPTEFQPARLTQLIASDAGVLVYAPWSKEPETPRSLSAAIGALRGVSHGLTGAVLPLLPIGVDASSALSMHDARVVGSEEIDGTTCDVIEAKRGRGRPEVTEHLRIWIAQTDSLIRRFSEDLVESAEEVRQINAARARALREAGIAESDLVVVNPGEEMPMTTFSTVTFHPKCNEPVAPLSLRATDGSL
jgi:hypothetical protein